jgi:hypothetical protein
MTLYNKDGTPYKAAGNIQQFDPNSPDLCLLNFWDQEAIKQGGSPIFYYEIVISHATVDRTWMESREKLYAPNPIQLYCFYEPSPVQADQGLYGIDATEEAVFEFNYRAFLDAVGHPPKIGSRIFSPHKRENWVIVGRKDSEFKLWGQFRLQITCQKFQESVTSGEGKVTQKMPDFKLNP